MDLGICALIWCMRGMSRCAHICARMALHALQAALHECMQHALLMRRPRRVVRCVEQQRMTTLQRATGCSTACLGVHLDASVLCANQPPAAPCDDAHDADTRGVSPSQQHKGSPGLPAKSTALYARQHVHRPTALAVCMDLMCHASNRPSKANGCCQPGRSGCGRGCIRL
jgi:hypothetical protein